MNVKTWRPGPGCKACAQAARLFEEHTQIAMHSHARAMTKIREQAAEIKVLTAQRDMAIGTERAWQETAMAQKAEIARLNETVRTFAWQPLDKDIATIVDKEFWNLVGEKEKP